MDWLKKYCLEVRCIDGLDTYIISPEFYEKILSDNELLDKLWASKTMHRFIEIFHICCRENWICNECGYENPGIVIMPQVEADTTYYEKCPAISSIFKEQACRKCGTTLQNHLIFVD